MNNTIQIFASDHRTNIQWNLPFIRVTDNTSSIVNFNNDSFLYQNKDYLSEVARMLFVYKHINDFGNPSYIGFCHYRRFFASIPNKNIVIEDNSNLFDTNILTPNDQFTILKNNNADCILEYPFYDTINHKNYNDEK